MKAKKVFNVISINETYESDQEFKILVNDIMHIMKDAVSSNAFNPQISVFDDSNNIIIIKKIDKSKYHIIKDYLNWKHPIMVAVSNLNIGQAEYQDHNKILINIGNFSNPKNLLIHELKHAYDDFRSNGKFKQGKFQSQNKINAELNKKTTLIKNKIKKQINLENVKFEKWYEIYYNSALDWSDLEKKENLKISKNRKIKSKMLQFIKDHSNSHNIVMTSQNLGLYLGQSYHRYDIVLDVYKDPAQIIDANYLKSLRNIEKEINKVKQLFKDYNMEPELDVFNIFTAYYINLIKLWLDMPKEMSKEKNMVSNYYKSHIERSAYFTEHIDIVLYDKGGKFKTLKDIQNFSTDEPWFAYLTPKMKQKFIKRATQYWHKEKNNIY